MTIYEDTDLGFTDEAESRNGWRYENPPYYLTAYALAVKHGFKGSEQEWLLALRGDKVELRYEGDRLQWKWTEEETWSDLMDVEDVRGPVVERTLEEAQAARDAAQQSAGEALASQQAAASSEAAAKVSEDAAAASAERAEAAAGNAVAEAEERLSGYVTDAQTAKSGAEKAQRAAASSAEEARAAEQGAAESLAQLNGQVELAQAARKGAEAARDAAKSSETAAGESEKGAETAMAAARQSQQEAAQSAEAAEGSALRAEAAQTAAAGSASEAGTSAAAALESQTAAAASEKEAKTAQTAAEGARDDAAASRDQAKASASDAQKSAAAAKSSETAAGESADRADAAAAKAEQIAGGDIVTHPELEAAQREAETYADGAVSTHDASPDAHGDIREELAGKADLKNGKVDPEQMPALDYDPAGTAATAVADHDQDPEAHSDIRTALAEADGKYLPKENPVFSGNIAGNRNDNTDCKMTLTARITGSLYTTEYGSKSIDGSNFKIDNGGLTIKKAAGDKDIVFGYRYKGHAVANIGASTDDAVVPVELTGIDTPTEDNAAANKKYVDALRPAQATVVLTQDGWTDGAQTVTAAGVLADETAQEIHVMPRTGDMKAYMDAGIYCSGQSDGRLTFTCDSPPEGDVTVYVTIYPLT